jgi:zinc and cadmium transporter
MGPLAAILVFGSLMSAIALVGSLTLVLKESTLQRLISPLVALASGSLIGGALFHMIPAAIERMGNGIAVYVWVAIGLLVFLALEQVLQWHHCHRTTSQHTRPINYLILFADGLHNLIGGLSIGALFVSDFGLGLTAWLAAVAHEIPQELGDFGVLIHGGWAKKQALFYNLLSGLTFLVGGLIAYGVSHSVPIDFLIPLAAGNFLYIGTVDLVPEFKQRGEGQPNLVGTVVWTFGMAVLLAARLIHIG